MTRLRRRPIYYCEPKCAICGHGRYTGIHMPLHGAPAGSKPWGHEFQPEAARSAGESRGVK